MPRFLLGVSGSVAGVKWPALVNALLNLGAASEVRVVFTSASQHFSSDISREYDPIAWDLTQCHITSGRVWLLTDADEWKDYRSVHRDPVLHIDLVKWADVLLIAPLSANTLAKISNGLCDNLLTCIARAWDWRKPLLLAPAMNTRMWEHPLTSRQLKEIISFPASAGVTAAEAHPGSAACAEAAASLLLPGDGSAAAAPAASPAAGGSGRADTLAIEPKMPAVSKPGVTVVEPVIKALACGDVGRGAMATVETIAAAVTAALGLAPGDA